MNAKVEPKRKLEIGESWELPWVCWGLVKDHYTEALGASLILMVVYAPLIYIPIVGPAIGTFSLTFALFGIVKICRQWDRDEPARVSDIVVGLTNPKFREQLLPLAGAMAGLALFSTLVTKGLTYTGGSSLGATALSIPLAMGFAILQSSLNYFSISLLAFHSDIKWSEALRISFDTYFSNFLPLALVGLVLGAIAFACFIALVLPVFFFFAPMSLPALYFVYKATFEGFVLDSGNQD